LYPQFGRLFCGLSHNGEDYLLDYPHRGINIFVEYLIEFEKEIKMHLNEQLDLKN